MYFKIKKIFLALFLMLNFSVFSQFAKPFPDSSAAWIIQTYASNYPGPPDYGGFRYFTAGDTVIKAKNYHPLYRWTTNPYDTAYTILKGFYRLDSNKVYFLNYAMTWPEYGFIEDDTNEVILYDFNVQVGDSFCIVNNGWDLQYMHCMAIDSVVLAGETLKRWTFDESASLLPNYFQWIEGIGSNIGFFPYYMYFETASSLACFHNGIQYIPIDGSMSASSCVYVEVNEVTNTDEMIYPNPSSGLIHLKNYSSNSRIMLLSSSGYLIQEIIPENSQLNLTSYEAGFYFIKDCTSGKITKLILY